MECDRCGVENPDGQKFCGECGGMLPLQTNSSLAAAQPADCPACGATMPEDATFCGLCGHHLKLESQVSEANDAVETDPMSHEAATDPCPTTADQVNFARALEEPREAEVVSQLPEGSLREMVLVQEGWFLMGSPDGEGRQDEHPQHQVQLSAYYIDKCAVSNIEYEKFAPHHRRSRPEEASHDDSPVVFVSYQDCLEYCHWRSEQESLEKGTYSLPTEAQWEKAARGGYREYMYPWGNGLVTNAFNAREADLLRTLSVSKCLPNGFGLLHMGGNIREWCLDFYSESFYGTRAATILDPPGPQRTLSIIMNVVRGASFQDLAAEMGRCAARNYAHPSSSSNDTGFRCVRLAR